MAIRPVSRIKHVIDGQFGIVLNVRQTVELIKAVDSPVRANTTEVETGSKVNGIYLKVEAYATTAAALANVYIAVQKNQGNILTAPILNAIGADDLKRFIIHQEMVMLEQSVNGNPRVIFNGVIVIPRGYRRMGPDDRLNLYIFAPGVNISACVQCHYKEFR